MKLFQINSKSLIENGVSNQKELWEKIKGEYKGFSMELPVTFEKTTIKKDDKEEECLTMVFSTPDKDRHGDIVIQNWVLDYYKLNNVLIDSHNYDSITHIIGKVNDIRVEDGKLKGELEFATMNPKGVLAKEMVQAGFINTSSVGFMPLEFDNEGIILKSELLENSLVSVPANARALFEKTVKEIKDTVQILEKEIKEDTTFEAIANIKTEAEKKAKVLKLITLALRDMDKTNREKRKRLVFKAIRSL